MPRALLLLAAFLLLAPHGAQAKIARISQAPVTPHYNITVGSQEEVYTHAERDAIAPFWPDGTLGVTKSGSVYTFYGAQGSTTSGAARIIKCVGTLDDPCATSNASIAITNLQQTCDYAAGGAVYEDTANSQLLMLHHCEVWTGTYATFRGHLAMAKSTDSGATWADLGLVVQTQNTGTGISVTNGAQFVVNGTYLYLYTRDLMTSGVKALSVSRALLATVLSNAASGTITTFNKWREDAWGQNGLGGTFSPLDSVATTTTPAGWAGVAYSTHSGRYIMVSPDWTAGSTSTIYYRDSVDGLTWGPRRTIEDGAGGAGDFTYPSIIGTGADPRILGQSFWVYYVYTPSGSSRWTNTRLVRRQITLP